MPSLAGFGLWLPDVGGLDLYLTVPLTWVLPSIGGLVALQPAALAAAASLSGLAFGPGLGIATFAAAFLASGLLLSLLPPPLLMRMPATTITARTRTVPPTSCSRRVRAAVLPPFSPSGSRSSRRRCFSSWRLDMGRDASQRR